MSVEPNSSRSRGSNPDSKPSLVINVQSWATPIVGLAMLVVGLLAGYFGRPLLAQQLQGETPIAALTNTSPTSASTPQTGAATQQPASLKEVMDILIPQVKHFKGDPNAPVTFIEFSDFQCPFCGKFATGTGRQIEQTYVDQGKVRFGYWHMAFLGNESQWAAEASECAADQDKFWEYHDLLFESQNGENQGAFSKENLKGFAANLGLDTKAFNECLDSGKYTQAVQESTQIAQSIGVRSTPAFLINGTPMIGAQPFESFQKVIDDSLTAQTP